MGKNEDENDKSQTSTFYLSSLGNEGRKQPKPSGRKVNLWMEIKLNFKTFFEKRLRLCMSFHFLKGMTSDREMTETETERKVINQERKGRKDKKILP